MIQPEPDRQEPDPPSAAPRGLDLRTPAHERLVTELLDWHGERPVADRALVDELRDELRGGLDEVATGLPRGTRIFLGKTSLNALVCDGRYLDQRDSPFEWSPQVASGKLIHRALEIDHATHRGESVDDLVQHAWTEMATAPGSLADYLNGMARVQSSVLRHQAEQRITEYRDLWPLLPPSVPMRTEERMVFAVGDGAVVVQGTPDIVIGNVRDDRCRVLLIDLKTGQRNPMTERQDLRLYGLLATLKYGQTPFRWATYYVTEGSWDAEDVDPNLLRGAVQRVVDGARKVARLQADDPGELRLVGGSWCRFCGRRDTCPAAPSDDDGWTR